MLKRAKKLWEQHTEYGYMDKRWKANFARRLKRLASQIDGSQTLEDLDIRYCVMYVDIISLRTGIDVRFMEVNE